MEKARVFKTERGFEGAFWIGVALIAVVKLVAQGWPIFGGIVAAVLGIGIMWLYKRDQKQVRTEGEHPRLGDEVYYLGLLYTLTSLCAALVILFLFDGNEQTLEKRTDEMIGSFGIALLTTMAGIVMRMTLQRHGVEGQETIIRIPHSASDTGGVGAEIESVTVDLERYAYELRRQLNNSTNAFAAHANQTILQAKTTHAHMEEMMQAFHDGLEKKAKVQLESLKATYESVAERAEEARQRTEEQGAGIQGALERLEAQVRNMDESIERIRAGSGETAENLKAIGTQAKSNAEAFAEGSKTVTEGLSALAEATDTERTHHATREQFAVEIREMLNQQGEEWMGIQRQVREALQQMIQTNQALAEVSSIEFEDRANLQEATAKIAEFSTTAGTYSENLRDTEQELQRINTSLQGVQNALQDEGFRLAEVLKQAIVAFDEAKPRDSGIFNRILGR